MFKIVISVALYVGVIAFLLKGVVAYCNRDHFVTEP